MGLNPTVQTFSFRLSANAAAVTLPLARLRRLSLSEPVLPALQAGGAALDRQPVAIHERN